jgi:hypothetical protein
LTAGTVQPLHIAVAFPLECCLSIFLGICLGLLRYLALIYFLEDLLGFCLELSDVVFECFLLFAELEALGLVRGVEDLHGIVIGHATLLNLGKHVEAIHFFHGSFVYLGFTL